jgi:hypothetical protein
MEIRRFASDLPNDIAQWVLWSLVLWVGPLRHQRWFVVFTVVILAAIVILLARHNPEVLRANATFVILISAGVGVGWSRKEVVGIGFYELTAQIVPVLVLVVIIEMRGFRFQRVVQDIDRRVAADITIFLIAAGYESLRVLARGDPESGNAWLVIGSLVAASVGLVLWAVTGSSDAEQEAGDIS